MERGKIISSLQGLLWGFASGLEEQRVNNPSASASCPPCEWDSAVSDSDLRPDPSCHVLVQTEPSSEHQAGEVCVCLEGGVGHCLPSNDSAGE